MNNAESSSGQSGYLQAFSLSCDPFAEGIDARFFYGSTALMQRLDLLSHLTQFGESVVLVSGPPGSGKTTLLTRFVAQNNSQWRLCLVNADEFDTFPACLADAIRTSETSSDEALLAQWAAQTDSSQLLVIIIDNAEQLDETAFDRLCTLLKQPQAERLRLILFGTPETQQRLKQMLERKAMSCTTQFLEVPRLSEEDTASYLMYRLAVAGYSGESPFTATEVRAICKAADGRPATINQLAHEALLERHARARSKRIRPATGKYKINSLTWGIASIAVVAIATYLGLQRFYPTSPEIPDQLASAPMEQIPLAIPEPAPLIPVPEARLSVQAIDEPQPAELATERGATSKTTEPEPIHEGTELNAAQLAPSIPQPRPAVTFVEGENENSVAPVPDDNIMKEADTPEISLESVAPKSQPALVESSPEQIRERPETTVKATSAESGSPAVTLPHREAWLLEQPEASFSLQLLGSRSEKSVNDYIRRHQLDKNQTAYYKGIYKDSPWYVLMYGIYPNKQAALAGRNTLPAKIRKDKPWPRSLGSVHKAIREVE